MVTPPRSSSLTSDRIPLLSSFTHPSSPRGPHSLYINPLILFSFSRPFQIHIMPRVPAIRLAHAPHAHTPNRVVIVTAPLRPRLQPQPRTSQPIPKRTFTSTRPSFAREQNFYEILDLPTSASAAEIKKYHPPPKFTIPNLTPQTILRPFHAPPPRPQPLRSRGRSAFRPHLRGLQRARQRFQARRLRPRPRLPPGPRLRCPRPHPYPPNG